MFDLGFMEILVIGVVALLVFGPEELPRVARTVGHVLGRMRRYVADVKADINREMEQADLKKVYDEVQTSAQELKTTLDESLQGLERDLEPVAPSEPAVLPALAEKVPDILVTPVSPSQAVTAPSCDPAAAELKAESGQADLFAQAVPRKEV
jgi:sec-independent protein translocase protein TatB